MPGSSFYISYTKDNSTFIQVNLPLHESKNNKINFRAPQFTFLRLLFIWKISFPMLAIFYWESAGFIHFRHQSKCWLFLRDGNLTSTSSEPIEMFTPTTEKPSHLNQGYHSIPFQSSKTLFRISSKCLLVSGSISSRGSRTHCSVGYLLLWTTVSYLILSLFENLSNQPFPANGNAKSKRKWIYRFNRCLLPLSLSSHYH